MDALKIPPYLKKEDTVALAAPARKISREELEPTLNILKSWGLRVVFSELLWGQEHQFSGSDRDRCADFQHWLNAPDVKAILCARGGYGSLRIIDQLNFDVFQKNPKWITGYSDITVLHSHLHQSGYASLHSTMPINFERDAESTETLRKALFGETLHYQIKQNNAVKNRLGQAKGILVGGNLSLLYALQGSRSAIDTRDKILFIEDLDEYLYHIDRMLISLKRSGMLSQLSGFVVGGMSNMKDNSIPFGKTAEEIVYDAVKEYDYPVCFGFPAGHEQKNFALRFGMPAEMNVKQDSIDFKN
jgi:muramoyltetrapeptide carboxypeptidase